MTAATLLALGATVLHAAWNLLVKTSDDRFLAAWGQFLVGGLVFVPVLFVVGPPGLEVAPLLVCSSVVNVVYVAALVRAYGAGDFSLAYPLARGAVRSSPPWAGCGSSATTSVRGPGSRSSWSSPVSWRWSGRVSPRP